MTQFTGTTAGAADRSARRGRTRQATGGVRKRRRSLAAYLYVLPAFVVFAVFLGVPFLQSVQYSFYDWDGLSVATWAGFANYASVFTDAQLRASFGHALVLMVFYAAVPVALALFLTALISRANALRGMSFFRTVLFLPQVIASVVVAFMRLIHITNHSEVHLRHWSLC